MLTGSIVLPIKTLVMNALTLAAALGAISLAFEDGLLAGLFDYTGPEAVETVSLVFLFAVIFGLATDYAVLVMARIKEHHDLGASNEEAVATGIARTGRVITAAAIMIAVVFLAFAVSPDLLHEADRRRHGDRGADRRDHRPRAPGAVADAALRRAQLVGARPAAPLSGPVRHSRGVGAGPPAARASWTLF